jgi:hypothetical protein
MGNQIPAAWYPQRTGNALRVTKLGAMRVAFFLVLQDLNLYAEEAM